MVNFGEDFERAIFPIWRSYYLDYARLKKVLQMVCETYPFFHLIEKHNIVILNDPSRPFELMMRGAVWSFVLIDNSSAKNKELKVSLGNEKAQMAGEVAEGEELKRITMPGFELFIELDETTAALLTPEADFSSHHSRRSCINQTSVGYAGRMIERYLKDLATTKITKEIADSVGVAVMTLFLDGNKEKTPPRPLKPMADPPQSPGVASSSSVVKEERTTRTKAERKQDKKDTPKLYRLVAAASRDRPLTIAVLLPTGIAASYINPSIGHALYCYHMEVSNVLAQALKAEIKKVSNFYISQSHVICSTALLCADAVKMWKKLTAKERSQIRIAYRQTYSALEMLQQFCDQNCIAIGKILKKIDKRTHQQLLTDYSKALENLDFKMGRDSRISRLQTILSTTYSKHLLKGDTKQGKNYLDSKDTVSGRGTEISLAILAGIVGTMGVMIIANLRTMGNPEWEGGLFPQGSRAEVYGASIGLLPVIILIWNFLFSINVMVWEYFGINFAFMFELDPIFHWTGAELMRDSLSYILVWLLCVYQFLLRNTRESLCMVTWELVKGNATVSPTNITTTTGLTTMTPPPPQSNAGRYFFPMDDLYVQPDDASGTTKAPAFAYVDTTSLDPLYWVFPIWAILFVCKALFNKHYFNNRKPWIAITMWRILTCPYYRVKFSEFIIGIDVGSLGAFFFELQFYFCPFFSAEGQATCRVLRSKNFCLLTLYPNFMRLLQCLRRYHDQPRATRKEFPNLINSGKYTVSMIATVCWTIYYTVVHDDLLDEFGLWVLFICVCLIQTFSQLYTYAWDIVVDAGIWIRHDDGKWKLRKEKVYGAWWPYTAFCVVNLILTGTWIMKLAFAPWTRHRPYFWCIWGSIEMIRRGYWNFLRVENEHVNNTEGYRATRFAPVPAKKIGYDTLADDITERFLKTDKDKVSAEFPAIKGINFTGVTKFFAKLPESEQLNILQRLKRGEDDEREVPLFFDPIVTSATLMGTDAAGAAAPTPPPAHEGSETDAPHRHPHFKSKFFSELPEEEKVCLILEYLGVDETMNSYLARVGTVENNGTVTPPVTPRKGTPKVSPQNTDWEDRPSLTSTPVAQSPSSHPLVISAPLPPPLTPTAVTPTADPAGYSDSSAQSPQSQQTDEALEMSPPATSAHLKEEREQ